MARKRQKAWRQWRRGCQIDELQKQAGDNVRANHEAARQNLASAGA